MIGPQAALVSKPLSDACDPARDGGMRGVPRTFRQPRVLRWLFALLGVVAGLLLVAGGLAEGGFGAAALPALGVPIVLLSIRSPWLRLTVDEGGVTIVNTFRIHRLRWDEVERLMFYDKGRWVRCRAATGQSASRCGGPSGQRASSMPSHDR